MENIKDPQPSPAADNGKTVAIISYMTLIGWIIALVIHSGDKTRLGAYHLRQTLGLMILVIAVSILNFPLMFIPILGWGIGMVLNIGLLVFWIIGLISAINGEEKPLPIVGIMFQTWFAGFGL